MVLTDLEKTGKWLIRAYISNHLAFSYCNVAVKDLATLEIKAY